MKSVTNPIRVLDTPNGCSLSDQKRFVRTRIRVLYLSSMSDVEPTPEPLTGPGYELVPVAAQHDALALIHMERFDAVVIADEIAEAKILEFISSVQSAKPELPVFLFNDWVRELLAALGLLEMLEDAGERLN